MNRAARFFDADYEDYNDDLSALQAYAQRTGGPLLELGCGTGRVSRALAADGHSLTGIDLSFPMLAAAGLTATKSAPHYACMDITALAFRTTFAAIIAPYNTLNLLTNPEGLRACLNQTHHLLADDGIFLLQLYIPDHELRALEGKKRFQFQIFDCPDDSKIIKEILKCTEPQSCLVDIIERYHLRFRKDQPNEDWEYTYQILGYGFAQWQAIFTEQGFHLEAAYGDYDLAPFIQEKHTTLLLALRKGASNPQ
ncbi:MAG: class I SAM-dependent methyltransferase [Deltaproteobacteria bacterium]|nr:class I SAM-dependent methyltransferase [Deltaproteobacteria bacterium]